MGTDVDMWLKTLLLAFASLSAGIASALGYGAYRWQAGTRKLRAKLEAAQGPRPPEIYDAREIESLPPPVRRYFHVALQDGQPIIATARVEHEGLFNLSETKQIWRPFTSTQRVITRRPGFDWDGRIRMAPGLDVFVHDAYAAGEGWLRAALLGLFTVADIRGTPEIAQGELLRFTAEAVWYPTALLPSQGVRWQAIDDASARATIQDGSHTVSLEFRFDSEGLISSVRAETRDRMVGGKPIACPWQGTFSAYETRNGMRIPLEGEVAWHPPEGPLPYWRGRITQIAYEFGSAGGTRRP